ncbi:hypothetical protein [Pseudonocardia lacus]|uniref:hypothetical protein n=1 Tax=Pseudonocardia lacus TaxID=2835865 RepID=UPI001BDC983B|nr:hypothetical protein [Pseudonocardia lacus]
MLLLVGGLFFLVGTFLTGDPTNIECDGQRMGPGDVCISTDASSSGSYEKLVAEQVESERAKPGQRPYLVLAVVAGAGLVVGTTVAGARARRRSGG